MGFRCEQPDALEPELDDVLRAFIDQCIVPILVKKILGDYEVHKPEDEEGTEP